MTFNIEELKRKTTSRSRYRKQIDRIVSRKGHVENIERAVEGAITNLHTSRSFVIYGEPQSGKTEMMIALTARLLDEGFKVVVVLLNDSVQLLGQNLERFRRSGIDPAPKNFAEILPPEVVIGDREWIIFCKKNPKDLGKLIQKIGSVGQKVVIDDEADYASPNGKVNKGERTKINALIDTLLGTNGIYIGVTATPARLDLNNTFKNENEKWVDFPPHPVYKGQDVFFPTRLNGAPAAFNLITLPDTQDAPKYLREALFSFFVNVAHLNSIKVSTGHEEDNYSILIHTSGKRADHSNDYREVVKVFSVLTSTEDAKFEAYFKRIWDIAEQRYPGEGGEIISYVANNINRHTIVVMNSDADKNVVDYTSATNPSTLFTIAIGGNIVSRGVTFDNLLSMFFTRDVKHKIQQDTYIQRARMFGTRGQYLKFFELHIPSNLYLDWHKCFVFHRLSLDSIRAGQGSPVWLEDTRVAAVSAGSIDRSTVSFDSGEMSFGIFDYDDEIDAILKGPHPTRTKLEQLADKVGNMGFPSYVLDYVDQFSPLGEASLALHPSASIANRSDDTDKETITRKKGLMGKSDLEKNKYPEALHHFKIFFNANNKARVFYKYEGNIKFLKNLKTQVTND